ncbi:ABC transporter ATP-binding protein [Tardiphaga sp. vice352]|uniref:ABC transporter ATP-binding protein n=1 Tax=unclassified Tardiphaga TaxID=2631404 RepID=UPI0011651D38|nr:MULTISPECIES: ABC transporter ATP-binding protein [unclassified Tardiphaga]MBC7583209.1 ABC transporter ATP-binding protein [Tardiphaga sp.]QDM18040.1 ABC transporter ATP-binding protein [Tardiphaga sp. vice278]QDM23080.1 ABC transporter ATP-binding protein [Tardiphaga sp. vice154]QDM28245.1 ABC transporter ATP-binding protein [Tardiphaga sp. vice304]QDM33388.1 ABC transporter ATP-binding protein [Tardiphaga sp. vice352]
MLEVRNLNASYGAVQVLHDVNLTVGAGEIVGLVGANAAGKSTLMFTLAGLRTTYQGEVLLEGIAMEGLPAFERPARGLVLVPERRRLFPFMTVLENLEIGAYAAEARAVARQTLDEVFTLLPVLAERRKQVAGSMSGGEQQMLAIGRALMAKPRVLLLDEPTEGLAPIYVKLLFDLIIDLRAKGLTVMIVEQNVHHVLHTADRAYVLENGRIVMEGKGSALLNDERLKTAYLGL